MQSTPSDRSPTLIRLLSVALFTSGFALSALASVPLAGTVVEGSSVPGIALSATRSAVLDAYGAPTFCQGPTQDYCTYTVAGTGSVNVRYRGAEGGAAAGTGEDILYHISWSGYPQWETTAGITTTLAAQDPGAVTNAYPDGTVTYNFQNKIFRVRDPGSGFEVQWNYDLYAGTVDVAISLFTPTRSPRIALSIEQTSSNAIRLRWPEKAGGLVLESTSDVSTAQGWEAASAPTPVLTEGEFVVTLPIEAGTRFYRLAGAP